ncbi:hypothetical protein CFC21_104573, partial [Triticum aestivum]
WCSRWWEPSRAFPSRPPPPSSAAIARAPRRHHRGRGRGDSAGPRADHPDGAQEGGREHQERQGLHGPAPRGQDLRRPSRQARRHYHPPARHQ